MAEWLCADGGGAAVAASLILEADEQEGSTRVRSVFESPACLYGMRPMGDPGVPDVAHLSLNGLFRYWRVELAAFPRS
eukprot:6622302-Pyramimonas_sp.AAC.1